VTLPKCPKITAVSFMEEKKLFKPTLAHSSAGKI